jgi:hypothetical protein
MLLHKLSREGDVLMPGKFSRYLTIAVDCAESTVVVEIDRSVPIVCLAEAAPFALLMWFVHVGLARFLARARNRAS